MSPLFETFTVTEDHLKLAKRMYVSWDSGEFGAPAIDCKRPYGNSDVLGDIAEIVGMKAPDFEEDETWPPEDEKKLNDLHQDMKTVLQIGLRTGQFKAGTYQSERFMQEWRQISP